MPEYMAIRDNQVETKRGMLFKKAGERIMSKTLPNRHWIELRGDYSKMGLYEILTEMVSKLGYEDIPDSWGISDLQHILQENERKLRLNCIFQNHLQGTSLRLNKVFFCQYP